MGDPEKLRCDCCEGTGFIECEDCYGNGSYMPVGNENQTDCSGCKGCGDVECDMCDGAGVEP